MNKTTFALVSIVAGLLVSGLPGVAPRASAAVATDPDQAYHDQAAVEKALAGLAKSSPRVQTEDLAVSPGGRKLQLLIIQAPDRGWEEAPPAVLVVADPLGTTPLATKAALKLARMLADPDKSASRFAWYIIAQANPDGAARNFKHPVRQDGRNDRPCDDDRDGMTDEDGPDDLNGDGLITAMLLPHPEGNWILTEDDPPLPKRADPAKGEKGLYKLLSEGRDDDEDGEFNEDGPGGVIVGRNFPHAFEHWTASGGVWAASEPESRAILTFAFTHPEIALVLVMGESNTLAKVPEASRQVQATGGSYKVPEWMARRAGLDPEQDYPLDDLVQMARDYTGQKDLTAEDVLSFLDLGPAVNPNRKDLSWWNEISKTYQDFLKEAGLDADRIEPPPSGPGSVEEWAYYQYGVPAFAVDFWSVPKPEEAQKSSGEDGEEVLTPDRIETMSRDDLLALGEEKVAAFLRANDAPAHITPGMVIKALEGGMLTPVKIAEMMRKQAEKKEAEGVDPDLKALARFSADRLEGRGYLAWQKVSLPDGREALVGGAVPFAGRTPPAAMADSLLQIQVPFLLGLTDWLPRLTIEAVELEHRGADLYELTVYVGNAGRIPYPTAQGRRCRRPPPVALTLKGADILEGRGRQTIDQVPALGSATSRWLVRGSPGAKVTITAAAPSAGTATKTIVLDRKGGLR